MGMWKYRYTCSKTGVKVYQFEHTNQYMIVHPDGTVEYQRDWAYNFISYLIKDTFYRRNKEWQ